ncbi:hypothetical protein AN2351V1_1718 [Citrobacter koseri]|nr:hypothetical protein AN2351V1_1718 [Citrobacter koseri]CAH6030081.1 hypothetical protein AN2351V1_1718 [Citrobacter koseri]
MPYAIDNYYHFNGSSWRGGLPRGGGRAENGWFLRSWVIIIICAGL